MSISLASHLHAWSLWRVWTYLGIQDFRARYRKALLGPAWVVVTQVFWALGVGVIYSHLLNQPMEFFLPYLLIGFTLWGFISAGMIDGGSAFLGSQGYITQFTFPLETYVLRNWVTSLVPLGAGLLVFLGVCLAYQRPVAFGLFWAIPGLVILAFVGLTHTRIVAFLSVPVRDLPHAISSAMQLLIFMTPIMFTAEMLRNRGLDAIYLFNPLYYLIEVVRHPLMNNEPAPGLIYGVSLGYLAVIGGISMFVERLLARRVVYLL